MGLYLIQQDTRLTQIWDELSSVSSFAILLYSSVVKASIDFFPKYLDYIANTP